MAQARRTREQGGAQGGAPRVAAAMRRTRATPKRRLDMSDPEVAARVAGLRYVSDAQPGIRRKRVGKRFSYIGLDGKPIHDRAELERIASLGVPPAWTDVWISPLAYGHLQATGHDAKGRKQYRYHPDWQAVRSETKYERMIAFAEALPQIRARVARDLGLPGLPREKALATAVRVLDETAIRVGNEEYARENESFGLTTMRTEHVEVKDAEVRFRFRGKSGKDHDVTVHDRRLARIIKRFLDLPGQRLFEYLDHTGQTRAIESNDVNEYLKEIGGASFTAKDFRTWHGTDEATASLLAGAPPPTQTEAKHQVVEAIKDAAGLLGNTPAICRKSYVHPGVIEAYLDGTLLSGAWREELPRAQRDGLTQQETRTLAVLLWLEQRVAAPQSKAG